MRPTQLTIGIARRGFSLGGGAEAYLKRLAGGVAKAGHRVSLFTSAEWPDTEWNFGPVVRLSANSAVAFADELEKVSRGNCDVLFSLERVWRCDVYRAGDGVHRAWLERREKFATRLQKFLRRFNRKHNDILRLEKSLLADRGAGRVIVNSHLVKNEIVDLYRYPADKIDIVRNGVPFEQFRFDSEVRTKARPWLQLDSGDIAVLFAGSGWERKGLPFAIDATERCRDRRVRLLVAGRGDQRKYKSARAQFLGELVDLRRVYAAADIFILPTIYDPFSNACLEALACGLPVITTRANGFSEIIEDSVHGSLVDCANNLIGLRDALRFWSDAARRAAVRSTNIQCAARFDISGNVARTLEILIQAAASAASTSGKI